MAEDGYKVTLNVYDLSQGLARQLSGSFIGKVLEGIWHTGLVVYGNEYYFSGGIEHDPAGRTPYGTPVRVVDMGVTHVPKEVFEEFVQEISPRYTAESYHILTHNCNNFTNEVAQFLVGATIPDYIINLPTEVMSSPMGALIMPMIPQLEATLKSGAVPQPPQFFPPAPAFQPSVPTVPRRSVSTQDKSRTSVNLDNNPSGSKTTKGVVKEIRNANHPVVKPATVEEEKKTPSDGALREARSKVQDEITAEFAAIMATGTLRASEAAALATRRVMERHGRLNVHG